MITIITAIVTSVTVIIFSTLLSKYVSVKLVAGTILCSIAFIYVGFALTENITVNVILEVCVALFFYFIAILGYSKNGYLIAYGIVMHGLWDIFHHNGSIVKTNIPDYWPLYCSAIDFILGIYFFLYFKMHSTGNESALKFQ